MRGFLRGGALDTTKVFSDHYLKKKKRNTTKISKIKSYSCAKIISSQLRQGKSGDIWSYEETSQYFEETKNLALMRSILWQYYDFIREILHSCGRNIRCCDFLPSILPCFPRNMGTFFFPSWKYHDFIATLLCIYMYFLKSCPETPLEHKHCCAVWVSECGFNVPEENCKNSPCDPAM